MVTPIVTWEKNVYENPGETEFRIDVWRVPYGLPEEHEARDRFDDRSISVPHDSGSIWFQVWAQGERLAATATFAADLSTVQCDGICVEEPYQRQGIATALYELASAIFAAPVIPSTVQTLDAKAFWGGRTQITCR